MPITGSEYEQRERDQILSYLEAELRNEFGEDIDLTESSAFSTFAEAIATVDSAELEPAIQEVHDAASLEDAEGELLDRLVAIHGIERRSAVHATGTVEFRHGSLAKQDYEIESGTVVQTQGEGSIEFETTERVGINNLDDFESGALDTVYGPDRSNFSVVDAANESISAYEGSYVLKSDGTSGTKVFLEGSPLSVGSRFSFHVYVPDSNAIVGQMFGVVDGENYYRTRVDASGHHAIDIVTPSGSTELAGGSVSVPTGTWLRNEILWSPEDGGTIVSRLFDGDSLLDERRVTQQSEIELGGFGFESLDGATVKYWDHAAMDRVRATIRARESGPIGNVGANTITEMPSVPNGVESITNPYPTGDDDHYTTDLVTYAAGRPREDDEELRDRARVSEGARGRATIPALIAALNDLDGAESVSVFENKQDSTDSEGRPPGSFEVVYYGTDPDSEVADTIFENKGFTANDVGGYVGTEQTFTVEAENGQRFDVHWSEPTELNVQMTLEIVVNDEFIGREELRNRIVQYVGGTLSDGTQTIGTGVGEDVYVDQIEDVVTGPSDTGVIGISSYSFSPSTTTDSNGLEVVDVGANEVANTSAEGNDISLNITRV